jgi:cytochrome c peroxidase
MKNGIYGSVCGLALLLSIGCKPEVQDDPSSRCWSSPDKPGVKVCEAAAPVEIFAPPPGRPVVNPRVLQRFEPLREDFRQGKPASAALVDLGRILYYDQRLSKNGMLSCNTCHPLERYGTTEDATPIGVEGKHLARNAPTTYNAAGHFAQFWDGRSRNVEEQALEPLLNAHEMGATPQSVLTALNTIPGYPALFKAAFPHDRSPISLKNTGVAIGAFERGLTTPSRWDRFLRGTTAALSDKEKDGLRIFTSAGCMVCHTGELVGGSMYQKVGAATAWPSADHGRREFTKDPADDMMFKVPSLRNVARTGPYFHDGSARTLEEAVRLMGTYQAGEALTDADVSSVVAFLGSLTGELPSDYIRPPHLPGTQLASKQGD